MPLEAYELMESAQSRLRNSSAKKNMIKANRDSVLQSAMRGSKQSAYRTTSNWMKKDDATPSLNSPFESQGTRGGAPSTASANKFPFRMPR